MALAPSAAKSTGIINAMKTGVGKTVKWVGDNPVPSIIGLNAVAGMTSPDQVDLIKLQQDEEEKQRERRERNLEVAGIDLGIRSSRAPLTDVSGRPVYRGKGLIGR